MPRVLLAPDKFKGSLTAAEVVAGLVTGIRTRCPEADVAAVPVADGGDGTLASFVAGGFERVDASAANARGERRPTWYVRHDMDAVIELAEVAGLTALVGPLEPLTATSRGVGEMLGHALDAGCTRVLLAIGGSASTDGGLGMVQALGARALDAAGAPAGRGGAGAARVETLDLSDLRHRIGSLRVDVACDVDNPLTGIDGAAAVYGPQKGADPDQVRQLDAALAHWADVVASSVGGDHRNDPGAGAAGGVGFAAAAILGAQLRPGAQLVLDLLGIHEILDGADLVVTGEGSLDEQTLRGKAPAAVAAAANAANVPVIAVAGRCTLDQHQLGRAGFSAAYALVDEADTPQQALSDPIPLLERIGARLGDRLRTANSHSENPTVRSDWPARRRGVVLVPRGRSSRGSRR